MTLRSTGKDPQSERPIRLTAHDLRKSRGHLVVTYDHVVASMRVERDPRVTKMPGHDSWLVLLVVVDPQFDDGLSFVHATNDTAQSGFCDMPGIGYGATEAMPEGLEGRRCAVWQDDGEVARVRERWHDFETGGPQLDTSRKTNDRPNSDSADSTAQGNQIVIGRAKHRDPEELVSLPAVTDLVGEMGVAQGRRAAPDNQQQIVRRWLSAEQLVRR